MTELPLDDWMVAWTPADWRRLGRVAPPGAIEVGPWPDETGWSDPYAMTGGCCEVARHHFHKAQKIMLMFINFHTCVVRDGVDPQAAHRAFLKIGELSPADQPRHSQRRRGSGAFKGIRYFDATARVSRPARTVTDDRQRRPVHAKAIKSRGASRGGMLAPAIGRTKPTGTTRHRACPAVSHSHVEQFHQKPYRQKYRTRQKIFRDETDTEFHLATSPKIFRVVPMSGSDPICAFRAVLHCEQSSVVRLTT